MDTKQGCLRCHEHKTNYILGAKSKLFLCAECAFEEDPPRLAVTGNFENTLFFWPLHRRLLDYTSIKILVKCGWFVRKKVITTYKHVSSVDDVFYFLEYYGKVICPAVKYDKWPVGWSICKSSLCEMRTQNQGIFFR